jgi:hypothetical protein
LGRNRFVALPKVLQLKGLQIEDEVKGIQVKGRGYECIWKEAHYDEVLLKGTHEGKKR